MLTIFQGTKRAAHLALPQRGPATRPRSCPSRSDPVATGRCRGGAAAALRGSRVGSNTHLCDPHHINIEQFRLTDQSEGLPLDHGFSARRIEPSAGNDFLWQERTRPHNIDSRIARVTHQPHLNRMSPFG